MSGLLDTGFLLVVLDADDEMHESCSEALLAESVPILPDVVSPELAYMVLKELGYSVFVQSVNFYHVRMIFKQQHYCVLISPVPYFVVPFNFIS